MIYQVIFFHRKVSVVERLFPTIICSLKNFDVGLFKSSSSDKGVIKGFISGFVLNVGWVGSSGTVSFNSSGSIPSYFLLKCQ